MPRGNVKMTYYFQYGTAIMDRTFDRRVDSARLEGQGLIKGWRMDFSRPGGQPNLVADPQGEVWGLLFLIDEAKFEELDKAEAGGERHEGPCLFEWEPESCVFYTYPSKPERPGDEYLKNLRENYRQAGLPQKQIDRALELTAAR
jgi:gamma-glutamylcyclotransferase (GGCT)/AIG2-like uncharacterized protein YtfP